MIGGFSSTAESPSSSSLVSSFSSGDHFSFLDNFVVVAGGGGFFLAPALICSASLPVSVSTLDRCEAAPLLVVDVVLAGAVEEAAPADVRFFASSFIADSMLLKSAADTRGIEIGTVQWKRE